MRSTANALAPRRAGPAPPCEYLSSLFLSWRGLMAWPCVISALAGAAAAAGLVQHPAWLPWSLMFAAATLFTLSSYQVWAKDHARLLALLDRSLRIEHADGADYWYSGVTNLKGKGAVRMTMAKISVLASGASSIGGVTLVVSKIEPQQQHIQCPLPLAPIHAAQSPPIFPSAASLSGVAYGPLNPGEQRFFEVAMKPALTRGVNWMEIPTSAPCRAQLDPGSYILTLVATGEDAVRAERRFVVALGASGEFSFGPDREADPAVPAAATARRWLWGRRKAGAGVRPLHQP